MTACQSIEELTGHTIAPKDYKYTTLKKHKERYHRFWTEGEALVSAGLIKGAKYRMEANPDRGYARIVLDPEGDRIVSGRRHPRREGYKPILDVCLADIAPEGCRVRADFLDGEIIITIHHEERQRIDREIRFHEALANNELSEAVLCSGIGVSAAATSEGLASAGIGSRIDWVVEMDGRYNDIARWNNPKITGKTTIFHGKLEEVEAHLISPVNMMQISLPCDGHSIAGRASMALERAEGHDNSATSVFGAVRLIDAGNPAIILSENVVEARNSATYELLVRELQRRNYIVQDIVLDGEQAGSLENRKRWFFVALSKGIADGFDIKEIETKGREHPRLIEALDAIDMESKRWKSYAYLYDKAARDKAAGKGFDPAVFSGQEDRIATIRKYYHKGGSTDPRISMISFVSDKALSRIADCIEIEGGTKTKDRSVEILRDMASNSHRNLSKADFVDLMKDPVAQQLIKERLVTAQEHARIKRVPVQLIEGVSDTIAHEGLGQAGLQGQFEGLANVVARHAINLKSSNDDEYAVSANKKIRFISDDNDGGMTENSVENAMKALDETMREQIDMFGA